MKKCGTWGVPTVGLAVVLAVAGCSGGTPREVPAVTGPAPSTGGLPSQSPTADPTLPSPAAPSTDAAAGAVPTGTATSAPQAPATATAAPPAGITEPPRIPAEESAALGGFAACAQRYQERTSGLTLGGAVTPVLLEQWSQSYEAASALAAEGDPVGAEQACLALQREMDAVLG